MKKLIITPIDENNGLILYALERIGRVNNRWLLGYVWTDKPEDFIYAAFSARKRPLPTIEIL